MHAQPCTHLNVREEAEGLAVAAAALASSVIPVGESYYSGGIDGHHLLFAALCAVLPALLAWKAARRSVHPRSKRSQRIYFPMTAAFFASCSVTTPVALVTLQG